MHNTKCVRVYVYVFFFFFFFLWQLPLNNLTLYFLEKKVCKYLPESMTEILRAVFVTDTVIFIAPTRLTMYSFEFVSLTV